MSRLIITLAALLLAGTTFAQDVDDASIISRVSRAIERSEELEVSDIQVTSVNGFVLLTGQTLSAEQKQKASVAVAFATDDMRRLINELEVVDALNSSFRDEDAALQSHIMDEIRNLTHNTTVVVYNGTVHLLGQVKPDERDAVATKVSKIPGVKGIRLSFEVMQ